MDDAKKQLLDRLQAANNVLVTVSRDPSVDQLAACIGLTLLLNKQGKHAAAVFSGQVPSTLEFLQPDETIEKNTDSLRDFIISLDKSKADKLRYKVEDDVVRIFITPYKTSLSQADLEFSEGDFNVDLVITLGVQNQEDLDEAITAHGRILHDATVACVNISDGSSLGSINWVDPQASSLCELIAELAQNATGDMLDKQIATALLTGIVAETQRFSNDKTSSQTMSVSAALMSAGANQQLVASELEEGAASGNAKDGYKLSDADGNTDAGVMEINHEVSNQTPLTQSNDQKQAAVDEEPFNLPTPSVDNLPSETNDSTKPTSDITSADGSEPSKLITEPPTMGGKLTANSTEEPIEGSSDPFSLPTSEPPQLLDHRADQKLTPTPDNSQTPPSPNWVPPAPAPLNLNPDQPPPGPGADKTVTSLSAPTSINTPASSLPTNPNATLADLEQQVGSPHLQAGQIDDARDEINRALSNSSGGASSTEPIQALNAQPLGEELHPASDASASAPVSSTAPTLPADSSAPLAPANSSSSMPVDNISSPTADSSTVNDPNAPPPVPPPIPFEFGSQSNQQPPQQ